MSTETHNLETAKRSAGRPRKIKTTAQVSNAWERYKAEKEEHPFMYQMETSSRIGNTKKYVPQPYMKGEFAKQIGFNSFSHFVTTYGNDEQYAGIIARINEEWAERLDFLAMTGAINPMYAARLRNLSDKQEIQHEGEVTTRSAEKQCTAEEAAAHFADWNSRIS